MKMIKTMIVEDNDIMRETIKDLLDFEDDIEVCGEASEIDEAMQKVHSLMPDVVLVDVSLETRKGGITFIQDIKKDFPKIPCIIVSGHDDSELKIMAKEAGAEDFVNKMSLPELLADKIRSNFKTK